MCLYHMLTGEYAYYSDNFSDTLVSICTQPLPRLRDHAPWVSESVETWFQRACAKEPLERFQSADEMTEALQASGGTMPLSKHKSVPEGRIAPETLVGFAAPPALGTLQLENSQLGLARTQALAASPAPGAITAPIAIAVNPEPRSITGAERAPRSRRNFRPLVIGLGLGLVALTLVAVVARLLGRGSASPPATASTGPSATAIAARITATQPAFPLPTPILAVPPAPTPVSVDSRAAADTANAPSDPAAHRSAATPSKKPTKAPLSSATPAARAAPAPRAPGSDLGF
jgi:eukaryotic-like serine/threonine-protein kinase